VFRPLATLVLISSLLVVNNASGEGEPVLVTVSILRFVQLDNPDGGFGQHQGDFYSEVTIDGFDQETSGEISGNPDFGEGQIFAPPYTINPNWTFSKEVDSDLGRIPVQIEIWDADGFGSEPDDVIDLSPTDDDVELNLTVDLLDGSWTGDIPDNEGIATGDGDKEHFDSDEGGEKGRVFFAVSVAGTDDTDGDGLLDAWETDGFDADDDGTVDVDFPAFGADPMHKDLFIELDHMTGLTCDAPTDVDEDCLSRKDITDIKDVFAAAPIDAGVDGSTLLAGMNSVINPDGEPGINLWIDTGDASDATASEDGAGAGTCGDGIDNGSDGADGADTDCFVGDNFGGGNELTPTEITDMRDDDDDLDGISDYYEIKQANFDPLRSLVFRYGISSIETENVPFRGQGERGGNDVLIVSQRARTLMHELGHNLGLSHGGDEINDCKPNYVSVMNLFYQRIPQAGAEEGILDFSPPRFPGGRGQAALGGLQEDELNEEEALDATDPSNRFIFSTGDGDVDDQVQAPLNQSPNWNQDTDPPLETDVTANVDRWNFEGSPCENTSTSSSLTGFNDWLAISLPFRQYGNAEDEPQILDPIRDVPDEMPDALWAAINTTDLAVGLSETPDPVIAGTELDYTATVENLGPNPATGTILTFDLPDDVSVTSSDAECPQNLAGDLECELGELQSGDEEVVHLTARVASSLVYDNGGPKTITTTASVRHVAGPDSSTDNNEASVDTLVVAEADLEVVSFGADPQPTEVLLGEETPVVIETVIANNGPSSPMDVAVLRSASADAGAGVEPASLGTTESRVGSGSDRTVSDTYTLTCSQPGLHTYSFDVSIAPADADDTDPDLSNNEAETSFTVDCVVPVAINIRPKGTPNAVNLNSQATLAVLTTAAGEYGLPSAFDATTIDGSTTRFGPRDGLFGSAGTGSPEAHGVGHPENSYELDEKTRDRDVDMVLHFAVEGSGLTLAHTEACVKGRFVSAGQPYTFFGCDSIVVRP
jgi:hypothetical protein